MQNLEYRKGFEKDRIDKKSKIAATKKQASGRMYPRFKVINWPTVIVNKDKMIFGIARNLSVSGAYIYYEMPQNKAAPLPLNAQVALVIKVPDRFPLLVRSEVVWSRIIKTNDGITLLGAGFSFTDIFLSDRQFLREMVAKYAWQEPESHGRELKIIPPQSQNLFCKRDPRKSGSPPPGM